MVTRLVNNAVMDTLGRDIGEGNKMAFLRSDGAVLIANRKRGIEFNGMWLSNSHSLSDAEYLEVYRSPRHIEPVAGVLKFDDNWYSTFRRANRLARSPQRYMASWQTITWTRDRVRGA